MNYALSNSQTRSLSAKQRSARTWVMSDECTPQDLAPLAATLYRLEWDADLYATPRGETTERYERRAARFLQSAWVHEYTREARQSLIEVMHTAVRQTRHDGVLPRKNLLAWLDSIHASVGTYEIEGLAPVEDAS